MVRAIVLIEEKKFIKDFRTGMMWRVEKKEERKTKPKTEKVPSREQIIDLDWGSWF